MNSGNLPVIAISMGDPAGIGPEIIVKALADESILQKARWIVVGDAAVIEMTTEELGLKLPSSVARELSEGRLNTPLVILDRQKLTGVSWKIGTLDPACGSAALDYVKVATELCLTQRADAMVTAPLNKEAVVLTGQAFTGHTEFIAALCGAQESRMLLINDRLRVIHVSTHCSLREACEVSVGRILRTIELGNQGLQLLGFPQPRIAVCGLNPHAGEHGLFGTEDETVIRPAVEAAQSSGIRCAGPFPADTLFNRAIGGEFDLIVAMFHDQGHIPMKVIDFEDTVNVSIGLPIIRTSVDHGTGFDIAGKNRANPRNMKAAMTLAAELSTRSQLRTVR